jgi:glutamine---fructose-6-phosphate transaminase (isomerizing)
MCGIFGIVTDKDQALGPILTEAAQRLTYRGYDSVGAATISGSKIDLRKDAGRVQEVAAKYNFAEMTGSRGITQLRWATFGEPSQVNSQPHLDSDGDLVGAHNGNVVNNVELRQQFMAEGMTVRSMNDGESCVHAVERYVNQGYDMIESIRHAYADLQGDYSFVIGRINDDKLYAIKKGSGLVVGIGEDFTCVSSDLPSILPLTRVIIRLQDGEIITLSADKVELHSVKDGLPIVRDPEIVTETMEAVQKGGYAHFMLKEIHEQAQVAREVLHMLNSSTDVAACYREDEKCSQFVLYRLRHKLPCLSGWGHLFRTDRRSSGHPCAGATIHAAICADGQLAGCWSVRQPERRDQGCAQRARSRRGKGMATYGLANVIGSTLTRATICSLPLCCGYEISVPATKTFTNQVVTFLYLAYRLAGREPKELEQIPALMDQTLEMVAEQVESIAAELNSWNDLYCLGYGGTYPIALEGALKLKEITYAHCEGMLSTEFKHGPLSAVSKGFPILFAGATRCTAYRQRTERSHLPRCPRHRHRAR